MFYSGARMRQFILAACTLLAIALARPRSQAETAPSPENTNLTHLNRTLPATLIYPALLSEYYEHGREHAPPRSPDGSMQRRELFYRAPPDPFDSLRSELGSSPADQQLTTDLQCLKEHWAVGENLDQQTIAIIRSHAEQSSIGSMALLNAARGFQWMVDDKLASAVFAVGLRKAWAEVSVEPAPDRNSQQLLHLIDQTRVLWNAGDPEALVNRFRIARRLTPRLSIESRRAGFHLAEALVADERSSEAADLILQVEREHRQAGDLGKRDKSDISEMTLVTGVTLFAAERYRDAVPYLALIQGDQAVQARTFLFEALLRSGQYAEAKSLLGDIPTLVSAPNVPQSLASRLNDEIDRARWKAEIGPLPEVTHH